MFRSILLLISLTYVVNAEDITHPAIPSVVGDDHSLPVIHTKVITDAPRKDYFDEPLKQEVIITLFPSSFLKQRSVSFQNLLKAFSSINEQLATAAKLVTTSDLTGPFKKLHKGETNVLSEKLAKELVLFHDFRKITLQTMLKNPLLNAVYNGFIGKQFSSLDSLTKSCFDTLRNFVTLDNIAFNLAGIIYVDIDQLAKIQSEDIQKLITLIQKFKPRIDHYVKQAVDNADIESKIGPLTIGSLYDDSFRIILSTGVSNVISEQNRKAILEAFYILLERICSNYESMLESLKLKKYHSKKNQN